MPFDFSEPDWIQGVEGSSDLELNHQSAFKPLVVLFPTEGQLP
jgi:hypothetical protein